MKTTAAITLCALTVSLAACTTSDETPPGSVAGLAAAEEGDEDQGIPEVDELDPSGELAEETAEPEEEEAAENEEPETDEAEQTAAPGEGEESAEEPDAAGLSDPVCAAFFEGSAPLAARADDARLLVRLGSVTNLTPLSALEIDVLTQQFALLGEDASDEQVQLIERINAPFAEVVAAAEGAGEGGEIAYEAIDTDDSDAAQEEFTQACLATG